MNKEDFVKLIDGNIFYRYEYADFLYKKLEEKDKEIEDYKSRCEKAIKYIDNIGFLNWEDKLQDILLSGKKMKKILEGSDKE